MKKILPYIQFQTNKLFIDISYLIKRTIGQIITVNYQYRPKLFTRSFSDFLVLEKKKEVERKNSRSLKTNCDQQVSINIEIAKYSNQLNLPSYANKTQNKALIS